jgi:ankyrin repeat protein
MDVRRLAIGGAVLAFVTLDPHLGARGPRAQARELAADAAERRDADALRQLLKQGADPNAPQPDGATALHWAVHWDDHAAVDALVRAGAKPDAVNDLGVFPLSLACANGSNAMAERLVAAGASMRTALPSGETPLMTCARTGAVQAIRVLGARGADVHARESNRGQTALMWAAGGKHPAAVKALIELGADVNARSAGGFTPLMFAAREGDPESARLLLDAGARIDDTTPSGESALLVAAASVSGLTARDYRHVPEPSGHETAALLLVARGANINQADTLAMTALHLAVETRKRDLLKTLVARGANLDARLATQGLPFRRGDYVSRAGFGGATPFWLAAMYGDVETMQQLVAAGADWRLPSRNGTTPLMVAAGLGQTDSRIVPESRLLEAVKYLVSLGGDVNEVNNGGQTAMHGAAGISGHAIIGYLAAQGANLEAKDKGGRTPIDVTHIIQRPRPETEAVIRRLLQQQ